MATGDIIQIAAVVVAVGASLVALSIASMDRRNAIKIAQDDRRAAIDQARLLAELEAAIRLSVLEARGGHTDPVVSKDMGAETLALVSMLGPDRVPGDVEAPRYQVQRGPPCLRRRRERA